MLGDKDLGPNFGLVVFADIREVRTYEWSMPTWAIYEFEYLRLGLIAGKSDGKTLEVECIWACVERTRDWFHCAGAPDLKTQRPTNAFWKENITCSLDRWLPEHV